MDKVEIKESKYSETCCLINLSYFRNDSPSSISNLVLYYVVKNIMYGVDSIQTGINLH